MQSAEDWYQEAEKYRTEKKFDLAISCYDEVIKLNGDLCSAWESKGKILRVQSHLDEAMKCFDHVLLIDSKREFAWSQNGIIFLEKKQWDKAIEYFDHALSLKENNAYVLEAKGYALLEKGELESAIVFLRKSLNICPNSITALEHKGKALSLLARWKESLHCFDNILKLNPKSLFAWIQKGNALAKLGRLHDAIFAFDKALRIEANSAFVWMYKGESFRAEGYSLDALLCFDRALELKDTNYARVLAYKGATLYQRGRLDDAIHCLDESLQFDSANSFAWEIKGEILHIRGQLDEALNCLEKTLELSLRNINASLRKADILMLKGLHHEAIKYIDSFVNSVTKVNDDESKSAWLLKGIICRKMGLYEEAVNCFNKILENDINHISAQKEKERTLAFQTKQFPVSITNYSPLSMKNSLGPIRKIDSSNLLISRELNSGSFGIVYQGVLEKRIVAIKEFISSNDPENSLFNKESHLMPQLQHPNVVMFYAVCTENNYSIVMEYCAKGSLYQWLNTDDSKAWSSRFRISKEIAKGLAYLHQCRLIHADLKSMNILLDECLTAKITDFGLSLLIPSGKCSVLAKPRGSLPWVPPELLNSDEVFYSEKTDIFSFGMLLWEITARKIPYQNILENEKVRIHITSGKREEIPKDTPYSMAELIGRCWLERIEDRPTAKEAEVFLEDAFNSDCNEIKNTQLPYVNRP